MSVPGYGSRFHFEAIFANRLKYTEDPPVEIGNKVKAAILPFAQAEQVESFMEGIGPDLYEHLHGMVASQAR